MPGRVVSRAQRAQETCKNHNVLVDRAVRLYREDQETKPQKEQCGFCRVTADVEAEHNAHWRAGDCIKLSWRMVQNRYNGTISIMQSCAEESRNLLPEEADVLANFSIKMSRRGFGLSLHCIRQHANKLLTATGRPPVGKNWPLCFIKSYAQLHMHWAQHLEAKRGGAVNLASHKKWFKLLGAILNGNIPNKYPDLQEDYPDLVEPIEAGMIYGFDKTNFQTAPNQKEHVIGPVGEKVHQQRKGSRELITMVATVCANGTALEPVVIFKG
jgi:hypothetical protein